MESGISEGKTIFTSIVGFAVEDREVILCWTENSSLGILVRGPDTPFSLQIDRELASNAQAQMPDVVIGAMALMALCKPATKEVLSSCFDIANIMVYWDEGEERRRLLFQIVGSDSTVANIEERGWPHAFELGKRILMPTERALIEQVCLLYFAKHTGATMQ